MSYVRLSDLTPEVRTQVENAIAEAENPPPAPRGWDCVPGGIEGTSLDDRDLGGSD